MQVLVRIQEGDCDRENEVKMKGKKSILLTSSFVAGGG